MLRWVPRSRCADGEADEAWHGSRSCKPLAHFLLVLPAVQNDATDFVPTSVAGSRHDPLVILAAIETFDLPDVGFDVGVLQLLDGLDHKPRAKLHVISPFVSLHFLQLR